MKDIKDQNDDFEFFLDSLNGATMEKKLAALMKSKKITISQLKSLFNVGVELYSSMQLKEAEMVFLSYSTLNPYDHRGPGCLASIYLEKKDYKKALDILNVVKTYPTCAIDEVFINISLCHYKLKQYMESAAVFIIVKPDELCEFHHKRYLYLQQQLKPYLG